ncbi:hypothetical protein [Streptomyces sp. KL116D]|uniref:hypothetical protein n=1 Tax=Streptomyces sp. KL116D TaxID=3045152 RepID=UPI00355905C3
MHAQGFRGPAQYAQWATGGADSLVATYRAYDQVLAEYGQFPGGGIAGDENYRPGYWRPAPGLRLRHRRVRGPARAAHPITGDPVEPTAARTSPSSMLPAALDPQGKGIHCITSANGVDLDNARKTDGQFQNGFAMQSFQPGVDQYAAARTTSGMGWPYFTEELWLATPDGGLAAALTRPATCGAKVGADGVPVTVREDRLPFDETITLTVQVDRPVDFPLRLRVAAGATGRASPSTGNR